MSVYMAEIGPDNIVVRVIVCDDPAWPAAHLGGVWVETADPYAPAQETAYCGPGFGYSDNLPERFAPVWTQPEGAHDALPEGTVVWHEGRLWRSTTPANVWAPGVSGWHDAPAAGTPQWVQPTGAHDAYAKGATVTHNGQTWTSTIGANVWAPGVYGWTVVG